MFKILWHNHTINISRNSRILDQFCVLKSNEAVISKYGLGLPIKPLVLKCCAKSFIVRAIPMNSSIYIRLIYLQPVYII